MLSIAQKIGGQIVGIGQKDTPEYSFAALVHRSGR